jgi:hypothetical protein
MIIENTLDNNDSKVLVMDLNQQFYKMYENEMKSYDIKNISNVNLASNDRYLILNYIGTDRFNVFVFCGLSSHYDLVE